MNKSQRSTQSFRVSAARALTIAACATLMLGSAATVRAQLWTDATPSTPVVQVKRDSMTVTLPPLQRIEVKLVMKKGEKAEYNWQTDGAEVTFNLHAEGPDAPGGKAHTYVRGSSKGEKGEIVAVFDGVHGWSWRNTSDKAVTVKVTASGQFSELKKM
jgi:hypothetical protein